jgi:hypothetical protein
LAEDFQAVISAGREQRIGYYIFICSFNTTPYGRVQAVSMVIIRAAVQH